MKKIVFLLVLLLSIQLVVSYTGSSENFDNSFLTREISSNQSSPSYNSSLNSYFSLGSASSASYNNSFTLTPYSGDSVPQLSEVKASIRDWYSGQMTLSDLMNMLSQWKNG